MLSFLTSTELRGKVTNNPLSLDYWYSWALIPVVFWGYISISHYLLWNIFFDDVWDLENKKLNFSLQLLFRRKGHWKDHNQKFPEAQRITSTLKIKRSQVPKFISPEWISHLEDSFFLFQIRLNEGALNKKISSVKNLDQSYSWWCLLILLNLLYSASDALIIWLSYKISWTNQAIINTHTFPIFL